jgi:hypothetical protein
LFPIYDYEVMWKKVCIDRFRSDFRDFCERENRLEAVEFGSNPTTDVGPEEDAMNREAFETTLRVGDAQNNHDMNNRILDADAGTPA